jgi:hypothetical protein
MGMDAHYFVNDPIRRPQWRAERALRLVDHYPNPLRPQPFDDRYVRSYWQFLIELKSAGNDELRRNCLFQKMPDISHAHSLIVTADRLSRYILQAWLLTGLSPEKISEQFSMDPLAIDYFEKLFFNVTDRLNCSDWISVVIRGTRSEHSVHGDELSDEGLGHVVRLFAFRGGPLVLRELVAALAPKNLKSRDARDDIDEALAEHVRVRTMLAAELLSGHVKNVPVLKKALQSIRSKR